MAQNAHAGSHIVKPSFQQRKDWTQAYVSEYPVLYRNGLMGKCKLHEKDRALKQVFDQEILEICKKESQKRPLQCVDLLSAYGNCLLVIIHGMSPEEIFDAWSTEEKSLNINKSRQFD